MRAVCLDRTGVMFFHSSELVSCHMGELEVGDLVEFNVVHNKRTNKYCAAKVKFVERANANKVQEVEKAMEGMSVDATEIVSLPGVRKTLISESKQFMRKIHTNGSFEMETECEGKSSPNAANAGGDRMEQPRSPAPGNSNSTPTTTTDARPDRIARFKKTSITAESLLRTDSTTTRQPTTGNTECKGFQLLRQHSNNDNSTTLVDYDNVFIEPKTPTSTTPTTSSMTYPLSVD